MHINANDTVLTLTSGGCNGLNLLLNGAGHVVSVDCNPAQSSLLQLKATAIQQLEFEDVWQVRHLDGYRMRLRRVARMRFQA